MAKKHEIIEIAGEVRHETEKAYLLFDGDKEVWIPKSHGEWVPVMDTFRTISLQAQ
jgi:hypothetical protein